MLFVPKYNTIICAGNEKKNIEIIYIGEELNSTSKRKNGIEV